MTSRKHESRAADRDANPTPKGNGQHARTEIETVPHDKSDSGSGRFPDHDRLLVYGANARGSWGYPHAELWNLPEKKMLREFTSDAESSFPQWLAFWDRKTVNITCDDRSGSDRQSNHNFCWNWADGADAADRGRILLVTGRDDRKCALEVKNATLVLRQPDQQDGVALDIKMPAIPIDQLREASAFQLGSDNETCALTLGQQPAALFDVKTGKRMCTFPADHRFNTFDPSGRWCATVGTDRKLILWDAHAAEAVHTNLLPWPIGGRSVEEIRIRIHPSGTRLALWTHGSLVYWDVEQCRAIKIFDPPGHFTPVSCLAHNPSANLMVSGGIGGEILAWKGKSGELLRSIWADTEPIARLAIHPDGTHIAYGTLSGKLAMLSINGERVWTVEPHQNQQVTQPGVQWGPQANTNLVPDFEFHPAGNFLAVGRADGSVLFLEATSGKQIAIYPVDSTAVTSISFSQDGHTMASGSAGGRLHILNGQAEEKVKTLSVNSPIRDIEFIGGKDLIATAAEEVQIWETNTLSEILRLPSSMGLIEDIEFHAPSGQLYMTDQEDEIVIHDVIALQKRLEEIGIGVSKQIPTQTARLDAQAASWWQQVLPSLPKSPAVQSQ